MGKTVLLTESQFMKLLNEISEPGDESKLITYRNLAIACRNNALAQLLFIIKYTLPRDRNSKLGDMRLNKNWCGNQIVSFYDSKNGVYSLTINNNVCYSGRIGEDTLFRAIDKVISDEITGNLKINRPEGRTIVNDKRDLSPKNLAKRGINLSSRFYQIFIKYGNIMKQGGANKPCLRKSEFEYFSKQGVINPQDFVFEKFDELYINKNHKMAKIVKSNEFANEEQFERFVASFVYNKRMTCIYVIDKDIVYMSGSLRVYEFLRGVPENVTEGFKKYFN